VFFVGFGPGDSGQRGADQLSGWLLIMRQQAKRDGQPKGVRFIVDPNTLTATQVQYIEQPDDIAQGVYIGQEPQPPQGYTSANVAWISSPAVNLTDPNAFPVLPGDYLEIYGGGLLRRILGVQAGSQPNTYDILLDPTTNNPLPPTGSSSVSAAAQTNYRIVRQPQPLGWSPSSPGEPPLSFPTNVGVDFSAPAWNAGPPAYGSASGTLSIVPQRAGNYEIMFGPSGAVIGQGSSANTIILWVRNIKTIPAADRTDGKPVLVTVQTRTGFIAAHPVAPIDPNNPPPSPLSDPFRFARDGRSSGM
jgi:hypothetical protein